MGEINRYFSREFKINAIQLLVRQWPFGLSNPVTASRGVTFIRPQMALLLLIL
jgi:hypothetical protein